MDDIPIPISEHSERFIDRLRAFIRLRNLAYKTEKTYVSWIIRYIRFHNMQRPEIVGTAGIESYLSHMVLQRNVSINTQRTVLNALVFLYREFLKIPVEGLEYVPARRGQKIPVVFTHQEALRAT
ncbi:MAG: site-specific integrase [Pseudomonadales bacterium]